jgi:hypothetical protein
MQTNKSKYGLNDQPISITLDSLALGAGRCSAAIDNSTDLFLDALVVVQISSGIGTHGGQIRIWAYGSCNGGSDYGDGVPGTDSVVTLSYPVNLHLIGVLSIPNVTGAPYVLFTSNPLSVAQAFGGRMPDHWGIAVENQLNSAPLGIGNSAWYQGVYEQVG